MKVDFGLRTEDNFIRFQNIVSLPAVLFTRDDGWQKELRDVVSLMSVVRVWREKCKRKEKDIS
jgi:hypothetical protein